MYYECRHIMHNGARCHSPALRGKDYCYYHSRLHQRPKPAAAAQPAATSTSKDPLILPIIEDRTAVQVAISRVFNRLSSGSVDRHTAAVYLYGLQIASQNVERKQDILPFKAVESVSLSRNGEELAPKLRVCESKDTCSTCEHRATCKAADPDPDQDNANNLRT